MPSTTGISKTLRTRSPTEHLERLRKPHQWKEEGGKGGWRLCSPILFNRSETFHQFLLRSAIIRVNTTVQKWREIFCQKECCKDKLCKEKCCEKKEDKKMKDATPDERLMHLRRQLNSLGGNVRQWYWGHGQDDLIEQAMYTIDDEIEWGSVRKYLEEKWRENCDWVRAEIEEKMWEYGCRNLSDLHQLEQNLTEAEKEEAARLEEQERLEKEEVAAVPGQGADDAEEDDSDDFHLYSGIPPPHATTEACEQNIIYRRPALYQLNNEPISPPLTPAEEGPISKRATTTDDKLTNLDIGPPTPPLTPIQEHPRLESTTTMEDEFFMDLIGGLLEDIIKEREFWTKKKGNTFHPDCLVDKPNDNDRGQICAWKLHPIAHITDDFPVLPQKYPELLVTDPQGNTFNLEDRLPTLPADFEQEFIERKEWGLAIEELLRRGCNFEQSPQWNAVEELWKEGWSPYEDEDEDEDDKNGNQENTYLESGQELDVAASKPITINQDEEDDEFFNQNITYLEPGQPFDTEDTYFTMNRKNEDPELALIHALLYDTRKRQQFYHEKSDEQFWWPMIQSANPLPAQLGRKNHCPWKQHLLSDLIKDLQPPTQGFPNIRVTDPEGNTYTLEECPVVMDEWFEDHLEERDGWQSRKETSLRESGRETEELYCSRLRHFAQWETEFRERDNIYAMNDIVKEPETKTKLQRARDAVEAFDLAVHECLFEVKQEFIQAEMAKIRAPAVRREEERKEEEKSLVLYKMSKIVKRIKGKLEKEGCVREKDGGACYVGQFGEFGEGVYWVEMVGHLGERWRMRYV